MPHAEVSYDLSDEAFGGDHQQAFEADLAAVGQRLDDARTVDQRRHTVATAAPQVRVRSAFIATVQLLTPNKSAQMTAYGWRPRRCCLWCVYQGAKSAERPQIMLHC